MKKIFKIIIVIGFLSFTNVLAEACSGSTLTNLQKEASNIKINYEVVENKIAAPSEYEFDSDKTEIPVGEDENLGMEDTTNIELTEESLKITVYNITKNFYLVQSDDLTTDTKTITYYDTIEGKYIIETSNITDYVNYKFEVYSNLDTCDTTLIKTINYTKPKLNPNANYQICVDNPTIPACQRFITKDTGVSEENIAEYAQKYIDNKGNVDDDTIVPAERKKSNFIKDNLSYIITIGSVIIVGSVIYIIISKKRSKI